MTGWRWEHFTRQEVECRCGCGMVPEPEFMDRLELLRAAYNAPTPVTSGARCPAYNKKVSTTGDSGPHTTGRAADIGVRGADARRLLSEALKLDFTGIGINQKGSARFVHVDDVPGPERIWTY